MDLIQFDEKEVWQQVDLICQSAVFSSKGNASFLLRKLVEYRIHGTSDPNAWTGDWITSEIFHKSKATTLGKVEGRDLRKCLKQYYSLENCLDDIFIFIPPGTFRPEIEPNPNILPDEERRFLWALRDAITRLDAPVILGLIPQLHTKFKHPRTLAFAALACTDLSFFNIAIPGKRDLLEAAERFVRRVALSPVCPWEAMFADACLRAALHWDWIGAEIRFKRSIAMAGDEGAFRFQYACFLLSQGRFEELTEIHKKKLQLILTDDTRVTHRNPTRLLEDIFVGQMCMNQMAEANSTIMTVELITPIPIARALMYEATNRLPEALSIAESFTISDRTHAYTVAILSFIFGLAGQMEKARELYAKILVASEPPTRIPATAFVLAIAECGLGEGERAIERLKVAAKVEADPWLMLLPVWPPFRHLRQYPGFDLLVCQTLGLSWRA